MGLKHLDGKWLWLAMLAFCVSLPAKAQGPAVPKEIEQHVNSATQVFENMLKTDLPPEKRALLDRLLKDAHGFAVFPNVQKMGMGMSTVQGMGVLAYRHQDGEWSPP